MSGPAFSEALLIGVACFDCPRPEPHCADAGCSAVAAAFIARTGRSQGKKATTGSSSSSAACEDLYVASVDGMLMR